MRTTLLTSVDAAAGRGTGPGSIISTVQPRSSNARAAATPNRPAPTITMWCDMSARDPGSEDPGLLHGYLRDGFPAFETVVGHGHLAGAPHQVLERARRPACVSRPNDDALRILLIDELGRARPELA